MGNELSQCYKENSTTVVTQLENHLKVGIVNETVEDNPAQNVIRDVVSLGKNLQKLVKLDEIGGRRIYNVRILFLILYLIVFARLSFTKKLFTKNAFSNLIEIRKTNK